MSVKDSIFTIRSAVASHAMNRRHDAMGLHQGSRWDEYVRGLAAEVERRLDATERSIFRGRPVFWVGDDSWLGGNAVSSVAQPPEDLRLDRVSRKFVPPEADDAWQVTAIDSRTIHLAARPLICVGRPRDDVRGTMFFNEPVDAVITWVDGADPEWLRRKQSFEPGESAHETSDADARYSDNDELRACLRGIAAYAPWIRHVFIVTDRQIPGFLDRECLLAEARTTGLSGGTTVSIVDHSQILPQSTLPTFNSHVIESALHRIPGLSEHYLYFNDDVVLGEPSTPEDFFTPAGLLRVALSPQGIHGDLPVMDSARNNRELLSQLTGTLMDRRFKHVPHAQSRSLAFELEEAIAARLADTRTHRFRDPEDVSFASSLLLSFAVATGRAVPSEFSYSYIDLGEGNAVRRLGGLVKQGGRLVNCFNQVGSMTERNRRSLAKALEALWPWASPWEVPRG